MGISFRSGLNFYLLSFLRSFYSLLTSSQLSDIQGMMTNLPDTDFFLHIFLLALRVSSNYCQLLVDLYSPWILPPTIIF